MESNGRAGYLFTYKNLQGSVTYYMVDIRVMRWTGAMWDLTVTRIQLQSLEVFFLVINCDQ